MAAFAGYGLLFGAAPSAYAAPTTVSTAAAALTGLQSASDTDLRLGADISISQPIVVTASVTVDLNGHDLTITSPASPTPEDAGATALTIDGGTLDVFGEGLLTAHGGDGGDGTPTDTDGGDGGAGLAFTAGGVLAAVAIDVVGGNGGAGANGSAPAQPPGAGGDGGVAIQAGTIQLEAHSGSVLILDAVGGDGGAGGAGATVTTPGGAGDGGNGGPGAPALGAGATINSPVEMASMVGGDGGPGGPGGDAENDATEAGDGGDGGPGASGSYWQGIFAGVAGDGGSGGAGGDSSVAGVAGGDGGHGGDSALGGSGTMSVSGSGGPGGNGGTGGSGAADGAAGARGSDGGAPAWGNDSTADFRLGACGGTAHYFAYPRNTTTTAEQWIDSLPAWWPNGIGVQFYGWFTGPGGTGSQAGPEVLDGSPFHTFYCTPTQPQRTVTFDGNGGPGAASVSVGYGDPVNAPVTPTRAGYVLEGWYDAAGDGGTAWNFDTPITADITLYAHWTARAAPSTSTPAAATTTAATTMASTAATTTHSSAPAAATSGESAATTGADALADTGVDVLRVGLTALALLAGGGALLFAARWRRTGEHS